MTDDKFSMTNFQSFQPLKPFPRRKSTKKGEMRPPGAHLTFLGRVCRPSILTLILIGMSDRFMKKTFLAFGLALGLAAAACAQSPGVPVVRQGHGSVPEPDLVAEAARLREAGQLLNLDDVKHQFGKSSCRLDLPPANNRPLSGSEIWSRARDAHLRVGYLYYCNVCKKLHLQLAGGYALTADGAAATCLHVLRAKDLKEGHLVAVTEAGVVLPVTEILACDKSADVCILRVRPAAPLRPLPLNANVSPGDDVWCYSDPASRPGFFSHGIVNRFYQEWDGAEAGTQHPRRMNVSTDWGPGSSGAAVVDRFGNAVGQVCAISAHGSNLPSEKPSGTNHTAMETVIVFHEAVCGADVAALVRH